MRTCVAIMCVGATCLTQAVLRAEPVAQTARSVPVVRDADVVVVGGGSAAVAAAVAAKTNGASVFLVAPRTYLGDDLAGTRELWPALVPEFHTHPLAQQVFSLEVPFSYQADVGRTSHPDPDNTRLIDGVGSRAETGSVHLTRCSRSHCRRAVWRNRDLYYYVRLSGNSPFSTTVAGRRSDDGVTWTAVAYNTELEPLTTDGDSTWVARIVPGAPFSARFLRLACNITPGGTYVRQLLDELVVHTDPNDPVGGSCCHVTPLTLKRTLDPLEEQGIPFLGGAPVCDVLRDADGKPCWRGAGEPRGTPSGDGAGRHRRDRGRVARPLRGGGQDRLYAW